jgi:hypothetical protein
MQQQKQPVLVPLKLPYRPRQKPLGPELQKHFVPNAYYAMPKKHSEISLQKVLANSLQKLPGAVLKKLSSQKPY